MNIYDHIITYNEEEERAASDYMDKLAEAHRRRKFCHVMLVMTGFVGWLLWFVEFCRAGVA